MERNNLKIAELNSKFEGDDRRSSEIRATYQNHPADTASSRIQFLDLPTEVLVEYVVGIFIFYC